MAKRKGKSVQKKTRGRGGRKSHTVTMTMHGIDLPASGVRGVTYQGVPLGDARPFRARHPGGQ